MPFAGICSNTVPAHIRQVGSVAPLIHYCWLQAFTLCFYAFRLIHNITKGLKERLRFLDLEESHLEWVQEKHLQTITKCVKNMIFSLFLFFFLLQQTNDRNQTQTFKYEFKLSILYTSLLFKYTQMCFFSLNYYIINLQLLIRLKHVT